MLGKAFSNSSCAKKIDHENESYKTPHEVVNLNQDQESESTVSTALCKDVFMCPQQCWFNYQFKDEQEINDEYTANGLLGSEENLKAISENDILK